MSSDARDRLVAVTGDPSFNPLFIGACLRTSAAGDVRPGQCEFQSPLHRGMSLGRNADDQLAELL